MQEKIDFIKWLTSLTPQKRAVALTVIIILFLGCSVYGLGSYIKSTVERNHKECLDNNSRLTIERDDLKIKLEVSRDKYNNRLENEIKELKALKNETEKLKKEMNEND